MSLLTRHRKKKIGGELCPVRHRQLKSPRAIPRVQDFWLIATAIPNRIVEIPGKENFTRTENFRGVRLLNAITTFGALVSVGIAQSAVDAGSSSSNTISLSPRTTCPELNLAYRRATEKTKLRILLRYLRPYPIAGPRSWKALIKQIEHLRYGQAPGGAYVVSELGSTSASGGHIV
jgi:hypothetical protein